MLCVFLRYGIHILYFIFFSSFVFYEFISRPRARIAGLHGRVEFSKKYGFLNCSTLRLPRFATFFVCVHMESVLWIVHPPPGVSILNEANRMNMIMKCERGETHTNKHETGNQQTPALAPCEIPTTGNYVSRVVPKMSLHIRDASRVESVPA